MDKLFGGYQSSSGDESDRSASSQRSENENKSADGQALESDSRTISQESDQEFGEPAQMNTTGLIPPTENQMVVDEIAD